MIFIISGLVRLGDLGIWQTLAELTGICLSTHLGHKKGYSLPSFRKGAVWLFLSTTDWMEALPGPILFNILVFSGFIGYSTFCVGGWGPFGACSTASRSDAWEVSCCTYKETTTEGHVLRNLLVTLYFTLHKSHIFHSQENTVGLFCITYKNKKNTLFS